MRRQKGLALDVDEQVLKLPRAVECFQKISADPELKLQLPGRGCLAGRVVKHALDVVETTHRKHEPLVYKFGITHCPVYRYRNNRYGYKVDTHQKWEAMIVLFASHESVGPSFLEGALIQTYKGNLTISSTFCQNVPRVKYSF